MWVWNQYDTNVIGTERDWYMLCFAYRWLGQNPTGFVSIRQNPRFKPDLADDRWVVERLKVLLDTCDAAVAHNGDKFDVRKANARFLFHGLDPPSPYQTVDTKKEAARQFANYSNSLAELGRLLSIGGKAANSGFGLWRRCMAGDPAAWMQMEEYNRQDVELLEALYLRLLPWIGHPGRGPLVNVGLWQPDVEKCPKCGWSGDGGNWCIRRGEHRTRFSVYHTVQCKSCGGYSRERRRERGHDGPI